MLVILAVVFFILWKYTHVLDGLKTKIKGRQEKWKRNAEEAARREREKEFEVIREKRRQAQEDEKRAKMRRVVGGTANCMHSYQPCGFDYDFGSGTPTAVRVIDERGHSIEECTICGRISRREVIAKINCNSVNKHIYTGIKYEKNERIISAGRYNVWFDHIFYLLVDRDMFGDFDLRKGDVVVMGKVIDDKVEKNSNYPDNRVLMKRLRFVDKDGVPILDDTPLSTRKIDIKEKYEIAEEKFGCGFYSLGENEQEECRREAENSHMVMLKVPDQECELRVFAEFSDS